MIKVVIIGSGNVAVHLVEAFFNAENIDLVQVYARNLLSIKYLQTKVAITDDLSQLKEAEVYILAISDNAIEKVSSKLKNIKSLVVHTSGATSIEKLQNLGKKGVFYMLQTFSKNTEVDFSTIPFCIEAEGEKDLKTLEFLAKSIGKKCYHINSEQRQQLHVSAVFVNNFTNHLYQMANDICKRNDIPFEILHPLILETATKVMETSPFEAQTGPARRNDTKTIQNHLKLLNKKQQKLYKLFTKLISRNYT